MQNPFTLDEEFPEDFLESTTVKYVKCPFCDEDDFDLIGLKTHFENGWCEVYNRLPNRLSVL